MGWGDALGLQTAGEEAIGELGEDPDPVTGFPICRHRPPVS